MSISVNKPLIVQGDKTVLLEVDNPSYEDVRDALARFAELVKSPEHVHTYRITPLSLWNAAAAGMTSEYIIKVLEQYGRYDLPGNVRVDVHDYVSRYGRLKLLKKDGNLLLQSSDAILITEITHNKRLQPFVLMQLDSYTLLVNPADRGRIKQALVNFGYPAEDLAGYVEGTPLPLNLLALSRTGSPFGLRHYQTEAADVFHAAGGARGGSGVVVLPCGAGKTMVGMGIMAKLQCATLILTPSTIAVRQWIDELRDKTSLGVEDIGEYTGDHKEIKPVTITTYQVLTYRPSRVNKDTGEIGEFPHLALFDQRDWGLIIYDEVHLLPAPVFRVTADIQARRRLGLTATLVREDGRETDVFSLIGPKKYDVPWKDLEKQGWIATAECHEIRIPMDDDDRMTYAVAEDREKYRLAACNVRKLDVIKQLLAKHGEDQILVIGQYIDQLHLVAEMLDAPLITGKTTNLEREKLYDQFRSGEIKLLVVSKVANFSIDLPDANVAIQISGTFGSRQEEAQRLGRILRPKKNGLLAHFYSLVSRDTRDQDFASKRQMFLTEQGYHYNIMDAADVAAFEPPLIEGQARLASPLSLPPGGPAS
jgi:DNA excision repair protein ERCC-3